MIVKDYITPDPKVDYNPHAVGILFRQWGASTWQIANYFKKPEHEIVRMLDENRKLSNRGR